MENPADSGSAIESPTVRRIPVPGRPPLSPERLRQVAEEVREAFPRPIETHELVLIDVDPRHLHAFWAVPPAAVEAARKTLAEMGDTAPLVLRIHEWTDDRPGPAFDIEVVGLQGQSYIDVWDEVRRYRATLGLRGANGSLAPLVASSPVELPALAPAEVSPLRPTPSDAAQVHARPAAPAPAPATKPVAPVPGKGERKTVGAADMQAPGDVDVPPKASPAHAVDRATGTAPPPASGDALPEPVRHPFPLPPAEAGEFVPEFLTTPEQIRGPVASDTAAPSLPSSAIEATPDAGGGAEGTAASPSSEPQPPRDAAAGELPEPVRYDFPLPPMEAGEYVPELIGGFLPPDTPAPEPAEGEFTGHSEADQPPAPPGEHASAPEGDEPLPLPLENVLSLSSFALGREQVEFEINAELHIFGRAKAGTQLHLFGRKVTLRPDGTFSITRPLPNGALVLSSLLVDGSNDGPSD